MKSIIKNQVGASMIMGMLAGAAVIGGSVVVVKLSNNQSKQNQSTLGKIQTKYFIDGIGDVLANSEACKATLSQGGTLASGSNIANILNESSDVSYEVSSSALKKNYYGGLALEGVTIADYIPSAGRSFSKLTLEISIAPIENKTGKKRSFTSYTRTMKLPIIVVTDNNQIEYCVSDVDNLSTDTLSNICLELGGTFSAENAQCSGLAENIVTNAIDALCLETGTAGCGHPYASKVCVQQTDVLGQGPWNNWFVKGFNSAGDLDCSCRPGRVCPSPASECLGVSLGTDYCSVNCGVGTKTDGHCCVPTAMSPSPNTICDGISFTQSNGCGGTQAATGTKTIDECATCTPSAWSPDPADTCQGSLVTQTNGCSTQEVPGTKTDGVCATCTPTTWSPDPADTCQGSLVTQTNGCSTQEVPGTKTDGACATCTVTWSPAPNTVCDGETFTQENTCNNLTQGAVGTKTDGICSPPSCSGVPVWQGPNAEGVPGISLCSSPSDNNCYLDMTCFPPPGPPIICNSGQERNIADNNNNNSSGYSMNECCMQGGSGATCTEPGDFYEICSADGTAWEFDRCR